MEDIESVSVLLIEDLVSDAKAITRAISYGELSHHFEITRVPRLQEGLDILKTRSIDVILLDLSLPDAKDIRAVVELHLLMPRVPIIVLSDQSDERIIQRALANGASRFLPKSEASGILIRNMINEVIKEKLLEIA